MNWGVSAGAKPPGGELLAHMQLAGAQFVGLQVYQAGMATKLEINVDVRVMHRWFKLAKAAT